MAVSFVFIYKKARGGDGLADFEAIYRGRFAEVYWTAYAILKNAEAARDAAQTVFLRALRHEKTVLGLEDRQLKLWLFRAARNACIDEIRRIRRAPVWEDTAENLPDTAPLPEVCLERRETRERVFVLVEALPDAYRRPILLYYFAEMPQKEIAHVLGLPESTLRSQLRRAKALLYRALEEGGELYG